MVVLLFKGNVLFATGSDTFARNPEASNFSLNGTSRPGPVFPGISVRVGLGGEMCTGFGEETDDTCNKLESLKIKKKQRNKSYITCPAQISICFCKSVMKNYRQCNAHSSRMRNLVHN